MDFYIVYVEYRDSDMIQFISGLPTSYFEVKVRQLSLYWIAS
jgi:hypothetical protein